MTVEEVKNSISEIPVGSKLQVIKTNGVISEVRLASHEVETIKAKSYGTLDIPELPAALIVTGGTRFGKYRIDVEEIVKIAWIE